MDDWRKYQKGLESIGAIHNAQSQYYCEDCKKRNILEVCSAKFVQTDKGEQLQFFCPDCHVQVDAIHESFYA